MGLNEWAVRIPGAFLSWLTILVVYLLVKELFKKEELALLSAFFLAISPWHLHFSRGGWEVNVATFFITLGVWLFVKKKLLISVLAFAASLYAYHAARVVVPLLGVGLLVIYFDEVKRNWKKFVIAGVLGLLVLVPLGMDLLKGGAASRAAGVGLFADPGPKSRIEEQRGEHGNLSSVAAKFVHNKAVNYGLAFLENWGKHYWGEFLFLSGDEIQRNKVPETGQMYLYDVVFVGLGLIMLAKRIKKEHGVILLWLLVAPVAAALTFQAPHALRAENMVIPLVILSAFGALYLSEVIKYKSLRKIVLVVLVGFITWNFGRYLHMYYSHMAKDYPYSSQYGVKELVSYVMENQDKYKKVIVTDRYDQPYILFLFYMKYDPFKFQGEHELTHRDQFGFSTVNHFDKYYFTTIRYDEAQPKNPNSLIAGTDEEIPNEANIVKNIYGSNGFLYFQVEAN
jgi:4-amino-4-deoxy-L-arabinose transferase-like glycosyltransferase